MTKTINNKAKLRAVLRKAVKRQRRSRQLMAQVKPPWNKLTPDELLALQQLRQEKADKAEPPWLEPKRESNSAMPAWKKRALPCPDYSGSS